MGKGEHPLIRRSGAAQHRMLPVGEMRGVQRWKEVLFGALRMYTLAVPGPRGEILVLMGRPQDRNGQSIIVVLKG